MLIKRTIVEGIARGDVTLAFRRRKRPTVKAGTRLRTALGEVVIGRVSIVDKASLDDECARRAGFSSLSKLKDSLRDGKDRQLFRIELDGLETDSRIALRNASTLDAGEHNAIHEKLRRWDEASKRQGYHYRVLSLIAERPATAAAILADSVNMEKLTFKRDVRKLKELGLTESLDEGYRLSPRGRTFLDKNESE